MRIALLHQHVPADAPPDEQDVLQQVRSVRAALERNGHRPYAVPVGLDLSALRGRLEAERPECVFNLVESLAGEDRLILVVPALLDTLGIPYTGAPLESILMTTNKPISKRWMRDAGLPTPAWYAAGDLPEAARELAGSKVILKPVWDHGSRGLDEGDVGDTFDAAQLSSSATGRGERFAERYVEGREFNLSLIQEGEGARVLPPAEMVFDGYEDGRPRVVGFRAKWVPESFEYRHTVRRFDFPASDGPLLQRLADLAAACWSCFSLRGYARIDFRVDRHGNPWILEVNVNPCLSQDAGLAAALERSGVPYHQAIESIVAAAGAPPLPSRRVRPGRMRAGR